MQRITPLLMHPDRGAMLVLALLTLSLPACLDSASHPCASGRLFCPASMRCSADGTSCIGLADTCGDGVTDSEEACDDGNRSDGDGCNHSCTSTEKGGNGFQDPGEACDDGNTVSGDGCSADFQSKETCGNGYTDTARGESCDDSNNASGDGCSADCRSTEYCGNNYTDTAKGEACDDGNNASGDGCSGDCRSNERCGNGYRDLARGEQCDDGNNVSGDGCSADCASDETCGNGRRDPSEACDDGNNQDGDQCSADCRVEGQGCGNGRVEPGELCDDGNASDEDDCLTNCMPARCGDGIVSPRASHAEQCDPGRNQDTPDCDADCTLPVCGDGIVNGKVGEQCDNGQTETDSATCTTLCRTPVCGDGRVTPQADEQCDDGNADDCGTCSATCRAMEPANRATGYIDAASASDLRDGESFTLDDGIHPPLTFEFTDNGGFDGSNHVRIPLAGNAMQMAQTIITAINAHRSVLNIEASSSLWELDRVELLQVGPTSLGNRPIIDATRSSNFHVHGMQGGGTRNCAENMGCRVDQDCAPWLSCVNGTCRP